MPTVTRRGDPNSREEAWLVFYGDVRVGTIGKGSGNPSGGDQWTWHGGFYPGTDPGDATNGTATNFDAARAAFESAWSVFLSKHTEADFQEYRHHRASNAWKSAMWEARCKLPTKPRCFLWHRYPDRGYQHIYTAHMSPKRPIIFCRGHEAIGCDRTNSVL